MSSDSLVLTLVAAFVLAFILGMTALRLKLSPLVGYLTAGVLVGPFTPGPVANGHLASQLAEIGVILLMFGVGLHFSPKDLLQVRRVAIPGAVLQVALGCLAGLALGGMLGLAPVEGALFGATLGIASTVVILRTLEEQRDLASEAGRVAVGWLVVQDLLAVLILVVMPLVARDGHADAWSTAVRIAGRLAMIAAFVGLMFVVGGRVLPWLLVRIAHTRSRELFTLGVLSIALGIAWFAYAVFGASFALGAFVAGLVLNGSPLGRNAAERSLPFRDAFAVLFFVSVGMLFDPAVLLRQPLALAGALVAVLASGVAASVIVAVATRTPWRHRNLLAGMMPQIGEFSFVLAGLGVSLGVLRPTTRSLVIGAAILSIVLNPLIRWAATRGHPRAESPPDKDGHA